ncbi:MAG: bifunctional phosphoribosylaminoimidazolecarboxamide formyltransferase/IMP cyclohydrolase [Candidatus Cloacimonadota bacterium]|nr:bifunctional phosphoribosylaminoimidazolecarboxamide formyltransferase/IMP cyclohydrolase [Candidatus Cloacimonadota bacterium]
MKRALISVSDKNEITSFAKGLLKLGYQIVSSGGTAKKLQESDIEVTLVSEVTKFPEMMNGRVKTLHPKIHGGILADKNNPVHIEEAKKMEIPLFDIVVVNLYPFEKKLNQNAPHDVMIENIDIGGPTLIRSAAKNHKSVLIITDFDDYEELQGNSIEDEYRLELALKAFEYTAHYDTMITDYFSQLIEVPEKEELIVEIPLKSELRYGENPHQKAEYYEVMGTELIEKLHGKSLSYNNYLDIDSALKTINKFTKPTVAIFKHTNPCGIASHSNLTEAYKNAFATDTLSPFGGIVIVNRTLDMKTALEINKIFTEIIIAPDFAEGVLKRLMKKKNRRLLKYFPDRISELKGEPAIVSCLNGLLCQDIDVNTDQEEKWEIVTDKKPNEAEMEELKFAWNTVASLKSNAVAFTKKDRTIGLGIGQPSRIDSTEIAVAKAKKFSLDIKNSVCASDGFFPFADSIETIKNLGVKAVIQPGGSRGDKDVIEACNKYGISMVFTKTRHFRH